MSISTTSIGEYRIERELGVGSFLARESNGRRVVLKMLEGDCLLKGQLHPMIKDRLGRVREWAHLGVANLHGAERDGERAFLVWEFVEGKTLEEYLGEEERERGKLAKMASEIVLHVESLHALGIVHGAIHGRNLIVRPDGAVKLTHVSPLLYHEEGVDVGALREVLGEMGFESGGEGQSLKELLEVIRPKEFQIDEKGAAPEGEHLRRWALIGAIVAAVIGAGMAWMIWRNAVGQQPREAAAMLETGCRVRFANRFAERTLQSCPRHPSRSQRGSGEIL